VRRLRRGVLGVFCVFAAESCGGAEHGSPAVHDSTAVTTPPAADAIEVSAELRGKARVRYLPELLATPRPVVRIVIQNRGTAALDVSNLRVRLALTRDGVSFPCTEAVETERSPHEIVPGAKESFDRRVDCAMPLVGAYAVDISVAFGRAGRWSSGQVVRTVALQVDSPKDSEPRELAGLPGAWGAIGTSRSVGTSSAEAPDKLGVSVVNASPKSLDVPPMRLALRVYKSGSPIPCEDEPAELKVPAVLAPGRAYRETIAVSCLGLHSAGRYEIVGRLVYSTVDGRSTESEIGRIRVEVSSDPAVYDRSTVVPSLRR
jgi:hypothetical protein